MDPIFLFRMILVGLVSGSLYALIAVGLSYLFGVMKIINFAYGDIVTIGAYITIGLASISGNMVFWLPLTMLLGFLMGVLLDRAFFLLIRKKELWNTEILLIVTLGISVFIRNFILVTIGPWYYQGPSIVSGELYFFGPWNKQRILIVGISALTILVMFSVIKFTKIGLAMRAVSHDKEISRAMGINVDRVYTISNGVGFALATGAGAIISAILYVHPSLGGDQTLKGFITIILGGMGNMVGSLIAALIFGVVESVSVIFWGSEAKIIVGLIMMILILLLKPAGILGKQISV